MTFLPHNYDLITGVSAHSDSAETYIIIIAYPEKEIQTIKHMGVFCLDKAGFLRLGHFICVISYIPIVRLPLTFTDDVFAA